MCHAGPGSPAFKIRKHITFMSTEQKFSTFSVREERVTCRGLSFFQSVVLQHVMLLCQTADIKYSI